MLPARCNFNYDVVPIITAASLRAQASRIRKLVNATTAAIIEIGIALISVKQSLEHGQFADWVNTECGFGLRTAENYIRAAEFADGKTKHVSLLNPSTVYRLAAKSAPPQIVQAVLDRAAKGEVVADAEVSAAFSEAKYQKRQEQRERDEAAKKLRRSNSSKQAAARAADRLQREERERTEQERCRVLALSIIDKLGKENARVVAKILRSDSAWRVLDLLLEELNKPVQQVA